MEIILGQARRRWSEDEKRALVAETLVEGQTVHGARRHNISRSMLFCWRKQYRENAELYYADVNAQRFYACCGRRA